MERKSKFSLWVQHRERGIYPINAFVGRGHDPADQVPISTLVPFNGSASELLRYGGVMTPPYEALVN